MHTPVSAIGEQTSLSDRKRRAAQRLLLPVPTRVDGDLRALLRELVPAGFVIDPTGAEEPAQLQELSAELRALLPAALPPLLLARHQRGRPCPGAAEMPPLAWLAGADDPALSRRVGQAWRRELSALGFQLHLAPSCALEPLGKRPLPGPEDGVAALLAGPSPALAARTIEAFVQPEPDAGCAPCPGLCQGWVDGDGRLVPLEKEHPGLLAEELAPVAAARRARAPALLLGWGRWPAFSEERPASCVPELLQGVLRERIGFAGVLIGEDLALVPGAEGWRRRDLLRWGLDAGLDLRVVGGPAEARLAAFEDLVRMQEQLAVRDRVLQDSDRRLLRLRELTLIHGRPAPPEILDAPAHRELALLARARGS
jgi:beta-N-acetylhexosaminidase